MAHASAILILKELYFTHILDITKKFFVQTIVLQNMMLANPIISLNITTGLPA